VKRLGKIIVMAVMLAAVTACGNDPQVEDGRYIVFEYNDSNIYLDEVYIYAQTTKEEYEQEYGEDIWGKTITTDDGLEVDVEEMARNQIINDIVSTKTLVYEADSYGIFLTAEEEEQQDEAAEEFYGNLTDEQIEKSNMQLDTVKTVMKENLLADKVYEYVMKDNTSEVSDEQARMTTFYDMFFECYYEDDFGNIVVYSADKIQEQKQRAYDAYNTISEEADSDDFNITFMGYTYGLKYAGSHTMSRDEIIQTYGQQVLDVLYDMNDGEISQVVETEYGYHIFQMTSLTDAEATAENKEALSFSANQDYFNNLLDSWINDIDKDYSYNKRVNEEVYDMIKFD
jgi:hypothetical protein